MKGSEQKKMKKDNQPYHEEDLGLWGTPSLSSIMMKKGWSKTEKTKSYGGVLPRKIGKELWDAWKQDYFTANRNPSSEGFLDTIQTQHRINEITFAKARKIGMDEFDFKNKYLSISLGSLNQMEVSFIPSNHALQNFFEQMKNSFNDSINLLFQK
jgi:hypothetical protein